jgi:Uma2 family endonuclease
MEVAMATQMTDAPPTTTTRTDRLSAPPLQSGDRLTRREFERRYSAMPLAKKAELIEGVVYMASPLHADHGRPHSAVMTWLGTYQAATPGTDLLDNTSTRLDADNEVQPDALLRLDEKVGGQTRIADGYVVGAPEFIVEIAVSSAAIDLGDKMRAYRRAGVREYAVWQTYEQRLDWLALSDGEYQPLAPDADGLMRSRVFPGLWLAVNDILQGDIAAVLRTLQQGLATPEHAGFSQRLKQFLS